MHNYLNYAVKTSGIGGIAPPFFTAALDGSEWWTSRSCRFNPWDGTSGIHWMGPTIGLGAVEERKLLHSLKLNSALPARPYTDWALPAPQNNVMALYFYSDNLEEIFLSSIYSVTTLRSFLLSRHDTNCPFPEMRIKQDTYVTHKQLSQVAGFPFLANCGEHVYMF